MSLELATRILHVKDGSSYDTIDILRGPKGDGSDIDVDDALSPSSENPVQNKVVTGAVNDLVMVSEQQPSSGNNKLWIEEDGTYVDLPTVGELNEVGSNIASTYDNSATYAVGEYCLHDRIAYRCTTAISTPEAWNAAHWTRAIIGDEITELNEDITELSQTVDGKVDDVQMNGTSIVSDGVANIPLASASDVGVMQIGADYGIGRSSGTRAYIYKATDAQLKAGEQIYRPVVSSNAHVAAFYGLARAAADTTQSASSNPVGTYTDAAKVAIQKMLGVYREWELIADVTTTEDLAEVYINTDINGQPFKLIKMTTRARLLPTLTGTRDYIRSEAVGKRFDDTYYACSSPAAYYPSATGNMFVDYRHTLVGDFVISEVRYAASEASSTQVISSSSPEIDSQVKIECLTGVKLKQYSSSSTLIPSGTRIKVYGIRA